ncbi:hypothetical protein [Alteromonas sp. H39]|uniref:hypothetical protein n=1 Tax=Alteromonas sp. H39 TaxID=3389876 RepID=UPI0039E044E0
MLSKVVVLVVIIIMLFATQVVAQQERDPTRPGKFAVTGNSEAIAAPVASRFMLNAIFYSTDRSQAIVNKQVVTVGSRLSNAMVSEIGPDSVVMLIEEQGETRETVLRLSPHASVKRDASEDF